MNSLNTSKQSPATNPDPSLNNSREQAKRVLGSIGKNTLKSLSLSSANLLALSEELSKFETTDNIKELMQSFESPDLTKLEKDPKLQLDNSIKQSIDSFLGNFAFMQKLKSASECFSEYLEIKKTKGFAGKVNDESEFNQALLNSSLDSSIGEEQDMNNSLIPVLDTAERVIKLDPYFKNMREFINSATDESDYKNRIIVCERSIEKNLTALTQNAVNRRETIKALNAKSEKNSALERLEKIKEIEKEIKETVEISLDSSLPHNLRGTSGTFSLLDLNFDFLKPENREKNKVFCGTLATTHLYNNKPVFHGDSFKSELEFIRKYATDFKTSPASCSEENHEKFKKLSESIKKELFRIKFSNPSQINLFFKKHNS